jgi:hypothetical protein
VPRYKSVNLNFQHLSDFELKVLQKESSNTRCPHPRCLGIDKDKGIGLVSTSFSFLLPDYSHGGNRSESDELSLSSIFLSAQVSKWFAGLCSYLDYICIYL